jgi:hypothetical protein
MCKPVLVGADHVESADFTHYLDLFKDGMIDAQVQLITELFLSCVPPPKEGTLVEQDQ